MGARKTARRVPKPGNHCWGHLVKSSEGQLLGGSGRFWAHFDRKWGGLDAQPIAEHPQFMPGSIPEVCDPKLGAAVKIAIWQRQNLYLEHIGSDRRIFSQDPHPMSCKMSRHGPSYVPSIKIYTFLNLLTWGVFGVHGHTMSDFRKRTVSKDTFDAELHGKPAAKRHQKPFASPEFQTRSGSMHRTPEGHVDRS